LPQVPFAYPDAYTAVPGQDGVGGYRLSRVDRSLDTSGPVCFRNGLCWLSAAYDHDSQHLELGWQVKRPLDLPPRPLISNPPPPGVYAGARLRVFGQLHDAEGFLAGDDGLWVDPVTLHPGDIFVQQHWPIVPEGSQPVAAVFGLYDPLTGERILTEDGRDHVRIELGELRGN
jgi:hypothetical protein